MKIKVSKQELRECVESAMLRIVKEGKSLRKFRGNEEQFGGNENKFGKKQPKHAKLGKPGNKEKGGANNQRWRDEWEED